MTCDSVFEVNIKRTAGIIGPSPNHSGLTVAEVVV